MEQLFGVLLALFVAVLCPYSVRSTVSRRTAVAKWTKERGNMSILDDAKSSQQFLQQLNQQLEQSEPLSVNPDDRLDDDMEQIPFVHGDAIAKPNVLKIENQNVQLPEPAARFANDIDKTFAKTVQGLRNTAQRMEEIATSLRMRAEQLEQAGPDISEGVRKWIRYERDSAMEVKFYCEQIERENVQKDSNIR